jgi:hypothetical protein
MADMYADAARSVAQTTRPSSQEDLAKMHVAANEECAVAEAEFVRLRNAYTNAENRMAAARANVERTRGELFDFGMNVSRLQPAGVAKY